MGSIGVAFWMSVDFRWSKIKIEINFGAVILEHTLVSPPLLVGFVGTTSREISVFQLHEWHATLNTKEMLRIMLAYADEHEIELEIDEETSAATMIDMNLGPQEDLDTPEKVLRQVLEASRLQILWRQD
jgi:hypothetical protein